MREPRAPVICPVIPAGLHRGAVRPCLSRTDIEGDVGVPVAPVPVRAQVLKEGHLVDETAGELHEGVRSFLRGPR